MAQVTSENIRKFVGQAAAAYGDAWKAQAEYYEGLLRRNTKAWTELADARIESFKEMRESRTFNQAFEANLAFEEKVREELVALQEDNTRSWESLVENLKAIYTPASAAPTAKPPAGQEDRESQSAGQENRKSQTAGQEDRESQNGSGGQESRLSLHTG
jgi:hypothetical protein